jgi:putative addiction module CopG family antidote
MTVKITPKIKRLIDKRVKAGRYASAEEVLIASLAALEQQETFGDFAPGELDALIEEGDKSTREEGVTTLEESYQRHLRYRRQATRRRRKTA